MNCKFCNRPCTVTDSGFVSCKFHSVKIEFYKSEIVLYWKEGKDYFRVWIYEDGQCDIDVNFTNELSLNENTSSLTPENIKQKVKLFLTFQ